MERLNEIMARTMPRQQALEHHLSQGQGSAPQAPGQRQDSLPVRRPLPEQTARLGLQHARVSQAHNQYNQQNQQDQYNQPSRTRDVQGHSMPHLPPSRPAYSRQRTQTHELDRLAGNPPSRMRPSGEQEMAIRNVSFPVDAQPFQHSQRSNGESQHFLHRATSDYYSRDIYPSMIQADVEEEWEDDTAGMRYGDWENDEDEGQVGQTYLRSKAEPLPRTSHPLITRNLGDAQALPPHIPSPPATPQEVRRTTHRLTQPLTPEALARMNQELPQEGHQMQKPPQQVLIGEQSAQIIPAPYTPLTAVCPICKGAGYLRADVPYGHPNFGKPIACECKEAERKEKRRWQLQNLSNLGELKNSTFENFRPNVSRAVYMGYQAALEYAKDPKGWLILIGKTGCGKTHLAAAIANRYLAHGSLVLFSTVSELLDHLRATFMPTSTEVYDQLFAKMREAELLVLDDLGAQQSSPWANEKLFQLLNYRYNSRFPTIITTNNPGLQGIEERIRSRMSDASLVTIVTFDGAQDYRPRNPRRD